MKRRRGDEDGFFTIWVLGLCVMLFAIGGITFDLWHAISDRRQISSVVDGAAVAGASQIDIDHFKATGNVRLDNAAAINRARVYLNATAGEVGTFQSTNVRVESGQLEVTAVANFNLSPLTRLLVPDRNLTLTVTGAADPRVRA